MKIICAALNYPATGDASPAALPEAPVLYLKPETALQRPGWPFFVPDFAAQVDCEAELVVRINHLGKSIPERYAHRYYDEVTVGLGFTCRDVLHDLQCRGLPWEVAKGFDGSAHIGRWLPVASLPSPLTFDLHIDGRERQQTDASQMRHGIDRLIAYASRYYLLKTGDLLFTGAPAGACAVSPGQEITAHLDGQEVLHVRVK